MLTRRSRLEDELPSYSNEIEASYCFDFEKFLWQSLITNSGYRLHLAANTAWIMRSIGQTAHRIEKMRVKEDGRFPFLNRNDP